MDDRPHTLGGPGGEKTDAQTTEQQDAGDKPPLRLSRRGFVGVLAAVGGGTAVGGAAASTSDHAGTERQAESDALAERINSEYATRVRYSRAQLLSDDSPVRLPHDDSFGLFDHSRVSALCNGAGPANHAETSPHASNDRLSTDAVVGKFGKSLEHETETGLPTTAAYESLVEACENGHGFAEIRQATLDAGDPEITPSDLVDDELHPKPLVQPETAWTYMSEGVSTAQLRIAVPPSFDDPETGAEMVELYWRALTRDVEFRDYDDDPLVVAAADELDSLNAYNGPGADGSVTPANVFRGVTPGAAVGPYVSQFLWKDRNLGGGVEKQRIETQVVENTATIRPTQTVGPPTDFMTSVDDWLKVQRGVVPPLDESLPGNRFTDERRYIITGRDMCERVHDDPPYRQVQKAAQVLIFTMNAPLDDAIPYTLKPFTKPSSSSRDVDSFTAQTTLPFNDFGPLYIEKKVLEASEHGQKAAWHKKWNVHRRLRPEEYGGRVQAELASDAANTLSTAGDGYPIPENLLSSRALDLTLENYGSYLLPQAYAEGSPTHPSYPAGHSVVAGAGVTVLKPLFDGGYEFPTDQKVVPTWDGKNLQTAAEVGGNPMDIEDTLTVRGELNKLASNMALGRNRAGIHYRTDGIDGLRLGEAAAIQFLEDQLSLPQKATELGGDRLELSLETFDGESLTLTPTV